jgi:hypothetical protein
MKTHRYKIKSPDLTSSLIDNGVFLNGRFVGLIDGRVVVKRVYGSKHFLRRPYGIAINRSVYEQIKDKVDIVLVIDLETEVKYRVGIDYFKSVGISINREHGEQLVVPMKYWITELPGQMRIELIE